LPVTPDHHRLDDQTEDVARGNDLADGASVTIGLGQVSWHEREIRGSGSGGVGHCDTIWTQDDNAPPGRRELLEKALRCPEHPLRIDVLSKRAGRVLGIRKQAGVE
jgi:hypothetical protein